MPQQTRHSLYDLQDLEPLLNAGYTLLTPNYRLARRIKSEWDHTQAERGLDVWHPAAVCPLELWLRKQWERAVALGTAGYRMVLTPVQELQLWAQVIHADRMAHGQYSLLQLDAAAKLARDARQSLLRWNVDITTTSVATEFALDADCGTFLRWLTALEQTLEDKGLATHADCCIQLLAAGEREGSPFAEGSLLAEGSIKLALVEFDDIPPLFQRCLDLFSGSVARIDSGSEVVPLDAYSYPDRSCELQAMARWAAASYRENPSRTLGMLLVDVEGDRAPLEYFLRREFDCLDSNYASLPVNFSTGISLDQAPVVRDGLRILAACGDDIPLADAVALLGSQFSSHNEIHTDKAVKVLSQLYQDGTESVSVSRLRYLTQQVKVGDSQGLKVGDTLREVDALRLRRARQLPSAWVQPFCQVLDLWGWPGRGPLDSLEYQQVEAWYRLLEDFAACDHITKPLGFYDALALLRQCCQAQMSQPLTPDSSIQVLGPLEGAGLHFDAVWICGLQGGRWPAPARPNPFIPMSLQRNLLMPHSSSEREWLFSESLMQRYRRCTQTMVASYSRQLDGVPELPSGLLNGIAVEHVEVQAEVPEAWLAQHHSAERECLVDNAAPPVLTQKGEQLGGGSGIVQDQASCPFRAFARRRLALEPLGGLRVGLSPADRGTILHDALYALWGDIGDSAALAALDDAARKTLVEAAAASAIQAVPAGIREVVGAHCLELEQQRLHSLLLEWLALESERPSFVVHSREEPIAFELAGLTLNLRVDRVDRLADGKMLVIDYKSGKNSLSQWLGTRPAQPQLPLYGLATDVSGLAFAEVRSRESKLRGLGDVDEFADIKSDIEKAVKRQSSASDWESLCAEWRESLEQLAIEFQRGDAQVDPLSSACNYCGFESLCRVELLTGADGEGELRA